MSVHISYVHHIYNTWIFQYVCTCIAQYQLNTCEFPQEWSTYQNCNIQYYLQYIYIYINKQKNALFFFFFFYLIELWWSHSSVQNFPIHSNQLSHASSLTQFKPLFTYKTTYPSVVFECDLEFRNFPFSYKICHANTH